MKEYKYKSNRNKEYAIFLLKKLFPEITDSQAIYLMSLNNFKNIVKIIEKNWMNENHVEGILFPTDLQKWYNCEQSICILEKNRQLKKLQLSLLRDSLLTIKSNLLKSETKIENEYKKNQLNKKLLKKQENFYNLLREHNRQYELNRAKLYRNHAVYENDTNFNKKLNKIDKNHINSLRKIYKEYDNSKVNVFIHLRSFFNKLFRY